MRELVIVVVVVFYNKRKGLVGTALRNDGAATDTTERARERAT